MDLILSKHEKSEGSANSFNLFYRGCLVGIYLFSAFILIHNYVGSHWLGEPNEEYILEELVIADGLVCTPQCLFITSRFLEIFCGKGKSLIPQNIS